MLEESEEQGDRSSNTGSFLNNEFYTAVMDEDLGRIDDMSKKYGSNFLIELQGSTPREVLWKGPATLPLHLAASYRRVKSMQKLLSTGADPEMRDQLGRTTLHLVIASWPSIPTTWPKPDKFRTVVNGLRRKAEACLRLLCEHGVNVNVEVEGSGQAALHLSVRYMALPAVHILASYGADINAVNSSGMAPLHMAAGILHKDIMTSLIKEGADMNMEMEHSGNTPLHLAAVAMDMKWIKTPEDGIGCISELLEQGAEADVVNKAGMTPLHEACSMGHEELVDLLLSYGADVNKPTRAGESCLFLFLNRRKNVKNSTLLAKLLSLTSTLTINDWNGHLPSTLTLPCFSKQRDQLLKLTQHPKRLQDICKSHVYLKHIQGKTGELRKILPEKLYDFVFNYWEKDISFVTDGDQDTFNDLIDVSLS